MSTRAFRAWSERLDSGVLTKFQIRQFANAISRRAMGEQSRGHAINITDDEARALYERIRANPVRLTDEHTDQGVTWLAKHGAKALGMGREEIGNRVERFDYFTWNGAVRYGTPNSGGNFTLPIWTVHPKCGEVWQYFNASWVTSYYDNAATAAWWYGVEEIPPRLEMSTETDYEFDVWTDAESFEDTAATVSASADDAIAEWRAFSDSIRERTERLRGRR